MNNRFIEIDSTHRNRVQFPIPSTFVIPCSFTPTKPKDPVLDGAIYFQWTSDFHPTNMYPLKSGTTNASPKLFVSNTHPQPVYENYYRGYIIHIVVTNKDANQPQKSDMRVVTGYDPVSVGVSLNYAFDLDQPIKEGDMYAIFEMNTPSSIHLPLVDDNLNEALQYPQAYDNYYIMDETLSYGTTIVARLIKDYDINFRYCHLDTPFPSKWSYTDSYTIRKTLPSEKWKLTQPTTTNESGFMIVSLPSDASPIDKFYVGKYIYFAGNKNTNSSSNSSSDRTQFKAIYGTYMILDYDGFTRKAVCDYSSDPNNPILPPTVGDIINIVSFSYDNYSPLLYTGSIVSQNQTVCYEIALVSLILPNATLSTGSRIAFYPFVYVELSNVTSPSGMAKNIIYSNNPDSGRALFIMGVTDSIQPVVGNYVKLLGKMRQIVKFKPNDSLRFTVYLPDGTLYQPVKSDLFTPYEPEKLLQINAVFSIKRL
jgi:hypothetical protein